MAIISYHFSFSRTSGSFAEAGNTRGASTEKQESVHKRSGASEKPLKMMKNDFFSSIVTQNISK